MSEPRQFESSLMNSFKMLCWDPNIFHLITCSLNLLCLQFYMVDSFKIHFAETYAHLLDCLSYIWRKLPFRQAFAAGKSEDQSPKGFSSHPAPAMVHSLEAISFQSPSLCCLLMGHRRVRDSHFLLFFCDQTIVIASSQPQYFPCQTPAGIFDFLPALATTVELNSGRWAASRGPALWDRD